jgi:TPP-dependent pyruvate/acetoin dehydrogenase alpha subunit
MTPKELIEFEEGVYKDYEKGLIHNLIHLSGKGNEQALIDYFNSVINNDWVFSTHRNHYHVLLKSKDPKWTKKQIRKSSMHINSKEHKIFTSSIVGGCIPIALGVALAIKIKGKSNRVHCFIGDMAAKMGIFEECLRYGSNFNLPIKYIEEDNYLGVCTPTIEAWGLENPSARGFRHTIIGYKREYPHHGIGHFVKLTTGKKAGGPF